jgi:hypothetical protein
MTNDKPRWRPYLQYLEQLGKQRAERGEAPAEDICPEGYWQERRQQNIEKDK